MLVFLLFAAGAVCAGIDAWMARSLSALALCLVAVGLAVSSWPG